MKKAVKISIGNLAFTVEQEAYFVIKGYLDEVQEYYKSFESSKEILEGIEERMAELFVEKCGLGGVVTLSVVNEIIDMLGRPEAFADESDVRYAGSGYKTGKAEKKLFRNPENRVLGGVCSGLAAYFSIDVTLMRILFIILFFGFSFFGFIFVGGASFIFLAYIAMWLIIPEAKTVEQKCAMYGESLDLYDLQRKMQHELRSAGNSLRRAAGNNREKMSAFSRLLSLIIAVVFFVVSVSGIVTLTFFLAGIEIFENVIPVDLLNYVETGSVNPLFMKIVFLSFLLLPFIGMLYLAIKLMFRFRSPRIRPGLVLLILWLLSFVALVFISVKATRPYWNDAEYSGEIELGDVSDTLYLDFEYSGEIPAESMCYSASHSSYKVFWMDSENDNIVVFPFLRIVRQSSGESRMIQYETTAYSESYPGAVTKAKNRIPHISIGDSLITISPMTYDKEHKFDGTHQQISLYLPQEVVVKVRKPLEHNFDEVVVTEWPFESCRFVRRF